MLTPSDYLALQMRNYHMHDCLGSFNFSRLIISQHGSHTDLTTYHATGTADSRGLVPC